MSKDDIPSYDPQETESVYDIPERFLVGDYLSLDGQGRWLYKNMPISNQKMRLFLFRHLMRTKEGSYWVVNGPQRALVELDDTPFFITAVTDVDHTLMVAVCDGSREPLNLEALEVADDHAMYTTVKPGEAGAGPDQPHSAKLLRPAVIDLGHYVEETNAGFAVVFGGKRYPIRPRA